MNILMLRFSHTLTLYWSFRSLYKDIKGVLQEKVGVKYLIPVFERECRQRCSIGKLQVCKVPVKNLSVSRRQINITEEEMQGDINWTH